LNHWRFQLHPCLNPNRLYSDSMTQAVAQILEEAEQLSAPERAELADRIVESLAHDLPPDIAQAQITEVRRRIAQVESGEVALIPGEEALARVRGLLSSARTAN
jgi:putative addiction module component (TIGR02574 family)